jgi:hypothetical protein
LKSAPVYPVDAKGAANPDLERASAGCKPRCSRHLKPSPDALEALGKQRASAVRTAPLANKAVKPERVFIVTQQAEAAMGAGAVRMEMKLD